MSDQNEKFWDHVDALRNTLIRVIATIGFASLISLFFYDPLLKSLLSPLHSASLQTEQITHYRVINTGSQTVKYTLPLHAKLIHSPQDHADALDIPPQSTLEYTQTAPSALAIFSPAEGLMTVFKVCFWVGMAVSSPLWLYWIYLFIAPALHPSEKRRFIPFTLCSLLFSLTGAFFCYHTTIPMANSYLNAFNAGIGVNLWGLSQYLNYTLILLLSNVIAFEMCVIVLFLVHYGVISDVGMRKHRAPVIVAIFTLSAILTPPDVFTQLMLALPLTGFYELGIVYARLKRKRASAQNTTDLIGE
jgi:sec-independent protein translocase protein TatC